jgi:hypothetical protein
MRVQLNANAHKKRRKDSERSIAGSIAGIRTDGMARLITIRRARRPIEPSACLKEGGGGQQVAACGSLALALSSRARTNNDGDRFEGSVVLENFTVTCQKCNNFHNTPPAAFYKFNSVNKLFTRQQRLPICASVCRKVATHELGGMCATNDR